MEKRRGLRSLIPTGMIGEAQAPTSTTTEPSRLPTGGEALHTAGGQAGVTELALESIRRPSQQPRQQMAEEAMAELVDSIRQHGILQPLVVRPVGKGEYELVAGERRYQAAKRLGLKTAPVVVREADEERALEMALVENLQREDINPMEAAVAYRRLIQEFGLNQEQVAERVGKSRAGVGNTLRLLNLPEGVQESLRKGEISEGHGKALATLEEPKLAVRVWRMVLKGSLSVQQTQAAVNVVLGRVPRGTKLGGPKSRGRKDPNIEDTERRLAHGLGMKVTILDRHPKGGVMQIRYGDDDDLGYLINRLLFGSERKGKRE